MGRSLLVSPCCSTFITHGHLTETQEKVEVGGVVVTKKSNQLMMIEEDPTCLQWTQQFLARSHKNQVGLASVERRKMTRVRWIRKTVSLMVLVQVAVLAPTVLLATK